MSAQSRVGLPAVLAIARHQERSGGEKRGVLIWQMFRKIILAINKKKRKNLVTLVDDILHWGQTIYLQDLKWQINYLHIKAFLYTYCGGFLFQLGDKVRQIYFKSNKGWEHYYGMYNISLGQNVRKHEENAFLNLFFSYYI